MKIKALIAFVMFTGVLFGQTTTYTGTVKDLSGAVVTSGNVTFTLTPSVDTTISGTSRFSPLTVNCTINGSGALVANDGVSACVVTQNTALTPTGTSYTICIQPQFTSPGSCFVDYAVTSSKDISTVAPTPQLSPSYPIYTSIFASPQTVTGAWAFNAFSGTATSLNVSRILLDCRPSVKADGTTDDGPAINACIANAVSGFYGGIKLPTGSIHIATAINATNLQGLTIEGSGSADYTHAANSNITELMCDTGTVCLDTAGSTHMKFKNFSMRIANTYSTPSNVAVLEGRTASNGGNCFSENNVWESVPIWTDHSGTANGGRGYIGVYNVGGEMRRYSGGYILADTPMMFMTTNVLTLTSPYETLGTSCPASMTVVEIGNTTLQTESGHIIESWTTADFNIHDAVFLFGAGADTKFSNAISFSGTYATNWHVTNGHVEWLRTNNSLMSWGATTMQANSFNFNLGGSLALGDAHGYIAWPSAGFTVGENTVVLDLHNEPAGYERPFFSNASAQTLNGGTYVITGSKKSLSATNLTLKGTKIIGTDFTNAQISFNSASAYEELTSAGREVVGALQAAGPLQFINGAGGSADTGLSRGAAGQVNVGNGTAGDASGTINYSAVKLNGVTLASATAPTITSGFGTSPSLTANGTAAVMLNVGTGGTASSGTITMPFTAAHGWSCSVNNINASVGNRADNTVQISYTTTNVTVQNQTKSTGVGVAWTASDVVLLNCGAF